MKKPLLLLLTSLLVLSLAPQAAAKAGAGRLDTRFGTKGKALVAFPAEDAGGIGVKYELPFQFTAGHLAMAPAPGGKIVVAGSTRIARFLANGKLDRQFGQGGFVAIARPPGQSFVLADVAVDSLGRILLAGSARPQPSESTPDPLLSAAAVMRFTSDGRPDPEFATEGRLIGDFGIEPPKIGGQPYKGPAVGLRSLAVDALNRPVVTGGSVTEIINCYGVQTAISTGFVARLTESGAPDPGFGTGGLRQIADFSSFGEGGFSPAGSLLTVASSKRNCGGGSSPAVVLASFGSDGSLDPGFGFAGFRSIGFRSAPVSTAIAPSGKIVLLAPKRGNSQLVMRLLADGAIDPSFGRIGRVRVVLPKAAVFHAVAADARGRLLFAGHIWKRLSKKGGPSRSSFLLARMKVKGSFDRAFGRKGSVRTGFGGPSSSRATQLMITAGGRIVVGGLVSTPRLGTGGGFALARYLSR